MWQVTAGKPGIFTVLCRDRYGNPAQPDDDLRFELAMVPAPEAAALAESKKNTDKNAVIKRKQETIARMEGAEAWPYEGIWQDDNTLEVCCKSHSEGCHVILPP